MKIRVNRVEAEVAGATTLLELIESRNYQVERILASVNGQICPVADYGRLQLCEGDEVELFSFVCGG